MVIERMEAAIMSSASSLKSPTDAAMAAEKSRSLLSMCTRVDRSEHDGAKAITAQPDGLLGSRRLLSSTSILASLSSIDVTVFSGIRIVIVREL